MGHGDDLYQAHQCGDGKHICHHPGLHAWQPAGQQQAAWQMTAGGQTQVYPANRQQIERGDHDDGGDHDDRQRRVVIDRQFPGGIGHRHGSLNAIFFETDVGEEQRQAEQNQRGKGQRRGQLIALRLAHQRVPTTGAL